MINSDINLISVILAAGKGTRMHSDLPKVLHPILNKPLLGYVLAATEALNPKQQIAVIGHQAEQVKAAFSSETSLNFALQEPQLGTGHALMMAMPAIKDDNAIIMVLCGDTPLIRPQTLADLRDIFIKQQAEAAVLTAILEDSHGYGRIIRDKEGHLAKIVEQKDASVTEQAIKEVNSGIYCFKAGSLRQALAELKNDNAQQEYYLTDVLANLRALNKRIIAVICNDSEEIGGINDRLQLANAAKIIQKRINEQWLLKGVTIIDSAATYIDSDVIIGQDTIIEPQTYLKQGAIIGSHCHLGIGTEISNSKLGDNVHTHHALIVDSKVGDNCQIGPFAYLRPGTDLANNVKAGHFVEIKKSQIGYGSKVPHLAYIGDAILGEQVNIGCGSITCNYDGKNKHQTLIGDHSFIGSNTNFVAPVSVGKHTVIGAGSTITRDVPDHALAIARSKQVTLEDRIK